MLNKIGFNDRNNNFNLIRFIASLLVIYAHSYPITGQKGAPLSQYSFDLGDIAVDVFFITSGFLVTNSLLTRKDLTFFIFSRFIRIFPGLFFAVLFCIFIIGPLSTTLPIRTYFSDIQLLKFFSVNISLFLRPEWNLPGVFRSNPYPNYVNSSLWTLPWEVRMYSILAMFGLILKYFKKIPLKTTITLVFATFLLLHFFNHYYPADGRFFHNLFRLTSMFFLGSTFYVYKNLIILSKILFFSLITLLLVSSFNENLFFISYTLSVGYIVLYFAFGPKGLIQKFNKIPDCSYGLYIYAFPIQQFIVYSYPAIELNSMFIYSVIITLALAIISWFCIEKPFLSLKSFYVKKINY